jgi:hypothetical protein
MDPKGCGTMKAKVIPFLLAGGLALASLTGCGGDDSAAPPPGGDTAVTTADGADETDDAEGPADSFGAPSDMLGESNRLYEIHDAILNDAKEEAGDTAKGGRSWTCNWRWCP